MFSTQQIEKLTYCYPSASVPRSGTEACLLCTHLALMKTFLIPQHTISVLSTVHKTKYSPKPKQKHSKSVACGGFIFKVESNPIDVKLVLCGEGRIWFKVQPVLSLLTFYLYFRRSSVITCFHSISFLHPSVVSKHPSVGAQLDNP